MKIFPAVDILGGKVVRLFKGDYQKVTNYSVSCAGAAREFKELGARYLHAVDLDGAKCGKAVNAEAVKDIISAGMFVEVGGGIRSEESIQSYLSCGAGRVILGTIAVQNFEFVKDMAKKYPQKIAVGVDAAEGLVAVNGWREVTDIDALEFLKKLAGAGIENVIYTDISTDGALGGTNLAAFEKLTKIEGLKITASGGITSVEEIKILRDMGVYAAILGKALYEKKLDLRAAIAAAGDCSDG